MFLLCSDLLVIFLFEEAASQCLPAACLLVAVYIVRGIFNFQYEDRSSLERTGISSSIIRLLIASHSCFSNYINTKTTACTI